MLSEKSADHDSAAAACPSGRSTLILMGAVCALCILALVATAIWPDLDVEIARATLVRASDPLGRSLAGARDIVSKAPFVLAAGLIAAATVELARRRPWPASARRRVAYLVLTLALGPGLFVNVMLKGNSHRPRPINTADVAGAGAEFRPFYDFSGACRRNCAFSSGETASAIWTAAPALIAPPPARFVAVVAAMAFGAIVGAMRIVAGAHYLSDVAFSGLLMLALILISRRIFFGSW